MHESTICTKLVEECCTTCGSIFFIPLTLQAARNKGRISVYCPSGHMQDGDTEAQKFKKLLEEEREKRESQGKTLTSVRADLYKAKDDKAKLQEEVAKLERKLLRVMKGVCAECNRSFTNLRRHMTSKHSH